MCDSSNLLKIEGTIFEVAEGKITKIKIGDEFFVPLKIPTKITRKEQSLEKFFDEKEHEPDFGPEAPLIAEAEVVVSEEAPDKGPKVTTIQHTPIYRNIMKDIQEAIEERGTTSPKELYDVIRKYYPNATDNTIKTYASQHKNYVLRSVRVPGSENKLKGKVIRYVSGVCIYDNVLSRIKEAVGNNASIEQLRNILKEYYPNVKPLTVKKYVGAYRKAIVLREPESKFLHKKKRRRRRRRKPSKDCVGFDKTYKTWVRQSEVDDVKRGILTVKFNYVPTFDNIIEETGMKSERARAALSYLINKGIVTKKYLENHTTAYYLED
jgi:uncharacterized protein YqfB (UPF0267 family)